MSKYLLQVRKANPEWLDIEPLFHWKWLASLEGAKLLRNGWQVRLVVAPKPTKKAQE
jgi:hypothetical protein